MERRPSEVGGFIFYYNINSPVAILLILLIKDMDKKDEKQSE